MEIWDDELDFQNACKQQKFPRRNFLGGILGFFVASSIPYIAEEPYKKFILQPELILPDYNVYVRLGDNSLIQGPGVKTIEGGKLILHDILATQFNVYKGAIVYYRNKLRYNGNFPSGKIPVCNGDTLRITCSI